MSLFRGVGVSLASFLRLNLPFRGSVGVLLTLLALAVSPATAQQGDGTIQGTITDPAGAVLPNATVTITNVDTGVSVKRVANGAGDFNASPLQAGKYNVQVEAKGFRTLLQENVVLDALQTLGLNLQMVIGSASEEVTITDAPPMLNTQDAAMGGTIENELYTDLPLSMNGGPRDPTQFQYLVAGVQEGGGTTGVFGGTGQEFLNQNYINGIPVSSIAAQGDPTTVRNAISVDAVDQFQVKTNGAGVSFGGAGITNYTIKSGGNQMHGTVFDYIRNTMFDTWGYFSKVPAANGYAIKPGEHQDSYGGSLGGPILKDKLFYFGAYEGYHYTKVSNTPQYLTIPTMRERTGDFTDAFGTGDATQVGVAGIFDPVPGGTRNQFRGLLNGAPTFNVIPQNEISSISQYLMQALPTPTNLSTSNNYLAGLPFENDDYRINVRLDYTLSQRQRISIVGLGGLNGYNKIPNYSGTLPLAQLPVPYAAGLFTSQKSSTGIVTHTFTINDHLINTFNYALTRTWGESYSPTDRTKFSAGQAGIANTPAGSATGEMPSVTFSGGGATAETAPTNWAANLWSGPQATNSFTIIDNALWVKGRHNWTFGIQMQWLETNAASYGGYSGATQLTYSGYNTENLNYTSTSNTTTAVVQGGSAFASFLVGAVYTGNVRTQTISDVGGRFKPIAPYVQDSWRVTPKLTVTVGLRYDYLQPWHETKNRFAYVRPDVTNPITGNPGVVFYGGYGKGPNPAYSPYICQCSTPIHPYNKNWEPQLAAAYSPNRSMTIRANFGVITTHAGGTGGHANATAGPGNNSEYAWTSVWQGANSTSAPAFFLNPGIQGSPQNSLYPPGSTGGQADYGSIPPWTAASDIFNPLSTTGNYTLTANDVNNTICPVSSQVSGACNPTTQNFVDLYYGGRGPQFVNYNFGIQQMINKAGVLSINYVGSQTHFLPGGAGRGAATNSIPPEYSAMLNTLLGSTITPAVQAAVQQILPNFQSPFPNNNYGGPDATVARALSAFPQFGNLTDIWGATGNSNYNALQVTYVQRPWHGISGFTNYTWSKSIDDVGQHRTQYSVSPIDGAFSHSIPANAVDRGLGTYDQRHNFNGTFNYDLPFGHGRKWLTQNRIGGLVAGGWSVAGIVKLRQGTPLQISVKELGTTACDSAEYGLQGTCVPDYNPAFTKSSARINGKWGRAPGANASNIQTIQYIDVNAFQCQSASNTTIGGCGGYLLGNVARSAPYGLRGPGWKDMDMGFRRTFNVAENVTFELEADVTNITNSTYFSLASGATGWNPGCTAGQTVQQCAAAAFGTIGGQNSAVPPRDWQFSGRFRF